MNIKVKLTLAALVVTLPGACTGSTSPTLTAFQRNIGPGSSVGSTGRTATGRGTPGDEDVPGVSTGRSNFGN